MMEEKEQEEQEGEQGQALIAYFRADESTCLVKTQRRPSATTCVIPTNWPHCWGKSKSSFHLPQTCQPHWQPIPALTPAPLLEPLFAATLPFRPRSARPARSCRPKPLFWRKGTHPLAFCSSPVPAASYPLSIWPRVPASCICALSLYNDASSSTCPTPHSLNTMMHTPVTLFMLHGV